MRTTHSHQPRHPESTAPMTNERAGRGSAGSSEPPRPAIAQPDREGDGPVDRLGAAEELWDALTRARAEYAPQLLAAAEDAVFRLYLPLAKTLSSAVAPGGADRFEAEHAAVVALAHAVVAWQDGAREGFDAFARAAINAQLRFLAAAQGQIWPDRSQVGALPASNAQPMSDPTHREQIPRPSGSHKAVTPKR
jgi:hypothetical protein